METTIFFLDKRTQISIDLIAMLKESNPDAGLVVIDVSHFHHPLQPAWRLNGPIESHPDTLRELFSAFGVNYLHADSIEVNPVEFNFIESQKLEIAINSSIITSYRRGIKANKRQSQVESALRKRMERQAKTVFSTALEIMSQITEGTVFIENGRHYAQHAIYLASKRLGRKVKFYEANLPSRSAYIEDYRVHDRLEVQKHALVMTSDIDHLSLQSGAEQIMQETVRANPFSSRWSKSDMPLEIRDKSIALFASSSTEEMESLDLNWNESEWDTQYEAFEAIWNKLRTPSISPVLRIHPNLLNKDPLVAHREIREVKRFMKRNPEFLVVWPKSTISTDKLLDQTELLVISNSTVGLAAAAQGIPVICSNSTNYDLIVGVIRIHKPEDLSQLEGKLAKTSPVDAWKFWYYLGTRDKHIPENRLGLKLEDVHAIKKAARSLQDGSLWSHIFELRWPLFRLIMVLTSPSK